ncbi:putative 3-phenylpropionic acid transporter [compost metagenome]
MKAELTKIRGFYLATGLSGGIFIPYLSLLLVNNQLTSSQIGFVTSLGMFISVLVQPIWGLTVDRFQITRLTLIVSCAIPAVLAMGYNSHSLILLAVISGATALFSTPQSAIADTYAVTAAKAANTSYGTIRCFGSIGFSVGGYLGGYYLVHYPLSSLWIPYALLGLIGAAVAFSMPRPAMSIHAGVASSMRSGLQELLRNRRFIIFLCGCLLVSQTLTAFNTYFALAFKSIGGSLGMTGIAFAIASATNVPAMLVAAKVMNKYGRERTLVLASVVYALRWALQAVFPYPFVAISVQVLHGISFGFYYVAAVNYVSVEARKELQATGQSLFSMVSAGFAGILGNLFNGYLLHAGGPTLMYGICTLSAVLGVACFWYVSRATKHSAIKEAI